MFSAKPRPDPRRFWAKDRPPLAAYETCSCSPLPTPEAPYQPSRGYDLLRDRFASRLDRECESFGKDDPSPNEVWYTALKSVIASFTGFSSLLNRAPCSMFECTTVPIPTKPLGLACDLISDSYWANNNSAAPSRWRAARKYPLSNDLFLITIGRIGDTASLIFLINSSYTLFGDLSWSPALSA